MEWQITRYLSGMEPQDQGARVINWAEENPYPEGTVAGQPCYALHSSIVTTVDILPTSEGHEAVSVSPDLDGTYKGVISP